MKKFAILCLIVLFNLSFLFGQSNRVKTYSESSPENENLLNRKKPRSNQTRETAKEDSPGDIIKIETDLVIVPVRISHKSGKIVSDLKKEEFKIFEDGIEQEIAFFSDEDQPFTVALVLDMSYSSAFKLSDIQEAAFAFINQLRQDDMVMIVSFDEEVRILCEPTNNRKVLRLAIEATKIASGSSVYAALETVLSTRLNSIAGRKAVVFLSDGVDTTSDATKAEKVLDTISETDVLVFPIQYDTYGDVQKSRRQNAPIFHDENDRPFVIEMPKIKGEREEDYKAANEFLNNISNNSGGRIYRVSNSTNLNQAFAFIANELRKFYSLGYYPTENTNIRDSYTLRVRVYRPNLIIRAKSSYLRKRARN